MYRLIVLTVAGIALSGCGGTATMTPQAKADAVTLTYMPIRTLATLCAAGIKPCEDPNISTNVAKALPIADAAVDEAVRQILANPDQSSVAKWSSYAINAIGVLVKVLTTYGIKG